MWQDREPPPPALAAWRHLEHGFDAAFGAALSPLRHLGSLGFLVFWLLAVSGICVDAVIDASVAGAYASIVDLGRHQPWAGGVLRSLHRYAADAFVILLAAHLGREWLLRHYRGARRHAWLTGVPTIALVFISAIGGFWLHWDQLAQYSAIATAEWLDALPLLATPLARNFLTEGAVSDRLFSLFVFVHLGAPLLLLFTLWFHIQRLTRAAVWPPRALSLGLLATLLALALLQPVSSHAPANLATVPQALRLDWALLFIHPLAEATSPAAAWALVAALLALLSVLPFLPQPAPAPVAVVDPANCNGCRRCFVDCPFAAVTMAPHPNGKAGKQIAVVDADLCTACGICVGACPSSTPFRSAADLVTGIDLPAAPIGALRRDLQQQLATLKAPRPIVVFGCAQGAALAPLAGDDIARFSLECTGMLPPSFVEYALRDGAAGVLVSTCRPGGCEYRLGQQWTEQRLRGEREPHLRAEVPQHRLEVAWADAGESGEAGPLQAALRRLRQRVSQLEPSTDPLPKVHHV